MKNIQVTSNTKIPFNGLLSHNKFSEINIYYMKNKNNYQQLTNSIDIPGGNFFYPRKTNYRFLKNEQENNFFFRYYDEDKVDKVNQLWREEKKENGDSQENLISSLIDDFSLSLDDDALTNYLIIEILKTCKKLEFQELYEKANHFFRSIIFNDLNPSFFNKRVLKIFDRAFVFVPCEYFYLSCQKKEKKIFNNIEGTYKELFCNICSVYDCKIHLILRVKNFDCEHSYNVNEFIKTYKTMIEYSIAAKSENETNFTRMILSKVEIFNNEIFKKLNIQKYKINPRIDFEDIDNNNCGDKCFKNFLKLSDKCKDEIYSKYFKNKNINRNNHQEEQDEEEVLNHHLGRIAELFFSKFFHIFKYDPCTIKLALNTLGNKPLIFNENFTNNLHCTDIYFKLLSVPLLAVIYSLKDYSQKLYNNLKSVKKKGLKISKTVLENIKENKKNSKFIIL